MGLKGTNEIRKFMGLKNQIEDDLITQIEDDCALRGLVAAGDDIEEPKQKGSKA